jgi:hypothetical protein
MPTLSTIFVVILAGRSSKKCELSHTACEFFRATHSNGGHQEQIWWVYDSTVKGIGVAP